MSLKTINDKISEGREYRDLFIATIETREEEDDKVVRGYATTFNEPYELYRDEDIVVNEQVDGSAFEDCDMSDVIMQYNHEGRVFARTSNGTLALTPDGHGLAVEAHLGGTALGRQLYEEIEGGYTDKMSFGFRVEEDRWEETRNAETGRTEALRTITRISKLYDVSAVSIPANDATSISARALGEGVIAEIKEERQKREDVKKKIRILLED